MVSEPFGAQPAVLRCARCGRFVNWDDARLQIICGCKGHLDLPPVLVREEQGGDRAGALDLFRRDFGHTNIVAFGEVMTLNQAEMLIADMRGELAGALAYRLLPDALHIIALATDPMWQRSGVGGHLVAEAELLARKKSLPRVVIATTNDNVPSLYFYQRCGYRIAEIVPGGMLPHLKEARGLGFAGIPVRDEIRLTKDLV